MKKKLSIHVILWLVVLIGTIGTVLVEAGTARPQPQAGFSFPWRQGGDGSNWGSDGSANYPVTDATLQAGAGRIPSLQAYTTIYFPQAYQFAPLVTASGIGSDVKVVSVSTNGFLVELVGDLTVSDSVFHWMAIGE